MDYLDAIKQIKGKQISPVYLLYGTDSFFIQSIKKQLMKVILPKDNQDNLITYDLQESPIQQVVMEADTYPFFGGQKLIFANNAGFLLAKPEKLPFEHDLDSLIDYVQMPTDYAVMVLVVPYEKIDERKKVSKQLKKNAVMINCHPISERDVSKWITDQATQLDITIETEAYEILEGEVSTDLYMLKNELEKMALYVGKGGTVTKQIAETLVTHTSNSSALRLVDAIMEQDLRKAVTLFQDLMQRNEEPIALVALVAYQFRMILRVKLLKSRGYSSQQIQKQLGVHPYVIKIATAREKHFSKQKLKAIIDKITDADTAMKQGKMEKKLTFELLLNDIVNGE